MEVPIEREIPRVKFRILDPRPFSLNTMLPQLQFLERWWESHPVWRALIQQLGGFLTILGVFGQFGMPYCADFHQSFTKKQAGLIQDLYKIMFSYVQQTLGCVGNCKQNLWDQFRFRNFRNWSYEHQKTQISSVNITTETKLIQNG